MQPSVWQGATAKEEVTPLSAGDGLGADQALEWEVVTAAGKHVVATPSQNPDLYWALSGGGGGTYAVVLSLTVKSHKNGTVSGAMISLPATGLPADTRWDLIEIWNAGLPAIVDAGTMAVSVITNESFSIGRVTYPDHTAAETRALLQPFLKELDKRNLTYALNVTSHPTYLQHFSTYFGPVPNGPYPVGQVTGGRLNPRSTVQSNNGALTSAMRETVASGTWYIAGIALNVAHNRAGNEGSLSNAVLPAWRSTLIHTIFVSAWDYHAPFAHMLDVERQLTDDIMPRLRAVTPDSGSYLNEADFRLKTWKQDFYGINYPRLRRVKARYDPLDLSYATTAVDSDAWIMAPDGRLCRA